MPTVAAAGRWRTSCSLGYPPRSRHRAGGTSSDPAMGGNGTSRTDPANKRPDREPLGSQRPERLCQCPYAAHARVHEKRTQAGKRYCLRSHRSEHNPGGSAPDLRGCGWVGRWIPLANPSPTEAASYTMVRPATMQTPPGRGSAEGARVPRGLHQHDEDSVNRGQALRRPPAPTPIAEFAGRVDPFAEANTPCRRPGRR